MDRLVELDLAFTEISDIDPRGAPFLMSLNLRGTQIGDSALAKIARLTELESLDITGTLVTSDGLVHLQHLQNLKTLYLYDTDVTEAAIDHLRTVMPDLKVMN